MTTSDEARLGALVLHPNTKSIYIRRDELSFTIKHYTLEARVNTGAGDKKFQTYGQMLSFLLSDLIEAIDKELTSHETVLADDAAKYDERWFECATKLIRHTSFRWLKVWGPHAANPAFSNRVEVGVDTKNFVFIERSNVASLQKALRCAWEELGWTE